MNASDFFAIPWLRWQQAGMDESFANLQRLAHVPRILEKARRVRKGATPSEVVYREARLKVLHYPAAGKPKYKTPLLFVFALVNRPYILDLKIGRSVVGHFVQHGFDTFLVDWGKPVPADHTLTLEDYVTGYLPHVVDHIRERTDSERVSILGYCMGGTFSAMFTALQPERVRNLILLAAGIDFARKDGLLNLWTQPEYFDVDRFVDAFGNCPPEFLQASFLLLKPVQNLIEKPVNLFERLADEAYLEDFLTMETWLNDNIAVPGEVFRSFVKLLYQQNLLVQNRMPIGDRIVNLRDITCPVLNIMAHADDIVPCAQSLPFNNLVGSKDKEFLMLEAGHIGLAVGGKAQKEIWPQACEWLAARS
jgi:poly[(R)-3-hydroxyalkanoate] polymerase subunit PhaC